MHFLYFDLDIITLTRTCYKRDTSVLRKIFTEVLSYVSLIFPPSYSQELLIS